jgi:aryl-alcohol dehydrogenase-like predicted oxidoreductase
MEYGNVPGIDKPISRIVQGMMQVKSKEEDAGFALLDGVFAQGCTAFDTARVYGDKDEFLGKWIAARGNRDQVVILAKGAHHSGLRKRVTDHDIGADLHDTLAAMRTDYVDLYLLHRDDPDYPVGPIVEALNRYRKEGKIKAFGGSNWSAARIAEANEYARVHNLVPFAASSPNYSLAEQKQEPWAGCVRISGRRAEPSANGTGTRRCRCSPGRAWRAASFRSVSGPTTSTSSRITWIKSARTRTARSRTSSVWNAPVNSPARET